MIFVDFPGRPIPRINASLYSGLLLLIFKASTLGHSRLTARPIPNAWPFHSEFRTLAICSFNHPVNRKLRRDHTKGINVLGELREAPGQASSEMYLDSLRPRVVNANYNLEKEDNFVRR